jgi:hypothetical protein
MINYPKAGQAHALKGEERRGGDLTKAHNTNLFTTSHLFKELTKTLHKASYKAKRNESGHQVVRTSHGRLSCEVNVIMYRSVTLRYLFIS